MSVKLFDCIVEDKQLLEEGDLTKEQAERVKAMILAGSRGGSKHPRFAKSLQKYPPLQNPDCQQDVILARQEMFP